MQEQEAGEGFHCLQEGAGVEELTTALSCLRDQLPAQAGMEAVLRKKGHLEVQMGVVKGLGR